MSLMLVVIWWGFATGGILLFVIFIVFFIAIARVVVNLDDDGRGSAADPLVWCAGFFAQKAQDYSCCS